MVNETAAKLFGLKDLIGEPVNIWKHKDTIIGIVKDYHYESLYESIKPIVFTRYKKEYQYITARIKTGITPEVIGYIQKILEDYFEDEAFNYYVPPGYYWVDSLAMGLFGLISFTVIQRTKEMGIRKVHGAATKNIVLLMIGDFGKFIIPAVAIAIPLALIIITNWMQNFAYRADISVWIYLTSIGIALAVSLIAILVRVIRFALANPADSLRYE